MTQQVWTYLFMFQSAQSAEPTRSILKTPMTPMTRKRVMFQEESSDTDASAVDIMVIDEKEVHRRMEALKRGEKVNSRPLHVVKSPSKPMKRLEKSTPITKTEQSPVFSKKPRFVDGTASMQTTPTKSKSYIDFETAFGFDD
ncbi:hypothetical protein B566_EDAN002642 [Ephemera danica]|nr:hypothetical protein B566_EDAN002642 [Ephemera danica]